MHGRVRQSPSRENDKENSTYEALPAHSRTFPFVHKPNQATNECMPGRAPAPARFEVVEWLCRTGAISKTTLQQFVCSWHLSDLAPAAWSLLRGPHHVYQAQPGTRHNKDDLIDKVDRSPDLVCSPARYRANHIRRAIWRRLGNDRLRR